MNEEDLSDIMKKITEMMNSNNSDSSNDSVSNTDSNYSNDSSKDNSTSNSNFNIDIETLFKVKTVMDKMNNTQNDPRANLLLSLKPYLKPSRKDKLEQYIKLLNMSNIIDILKPDESGNHGGENK